MFDEPGRFFSLRPIAPLLVSALFAAQACSSSSNAGGSTVSSDGGSTTSQSAGQGSEAGTSAGSTGSGTASTGSGGASTGSGPGADAAGGAAGDASDAASGASQSAACAAEDAGGAIVCDDFESAAAGGLPGSPWKVAKNSGSVVVDTTHAFSGRQSVKITAPSATGYRSVMLRLSGAPLPTSGNVVFGRMMFWLDSAPTAQVHWTFIDGTGLVAGTNYHAVYRYGGQLPLTAADGGFGGSQLMASYDTPDSYSGTGPSSDCYRHSQGRPVPVAAWTCAEWEFDGPNNTMKFWLGGAPIDDLTVAGTGDGCTQQPASYVWTAPSFGQIDLGWESYQADGARTMWIDDVAIGTKRIGCP